MCVALSLGAQALVELTFEQRRDRLLECLDPPAELVLAPCEDRLNGGRNLGHDPYSARAAVARIAITWSDRAIGSNGLVSTPATPSVSKH